MDTAVQSSTPTLDQHQLELAERILQFGFFIDLCFGDFVGNKPGHRALGIEGNDEIIYSVSPEELDTCKYRIGRILPFLYDYAYNARMAEGAIDWSEWNIEADERYMFGAFVEMTDVENVQCISAEYGYATRGLLPRMLALADARHNLDAGEDLSLHEIALLADMNERSVRNALRIEGENGLHSEDGEKVSAHEALRWLRGRRAGFKETTITVFDSESLPEALTAAELPVFINHRLARLYPPHDTDTDDCCLPVEKAARVIGWPASRVMAVTHDANNIRPHDCTDLAKALRVDPAWFTEQVMCALFPKQMALITYRKQIGDFEADETHSFIEVPLTENGIKHGYLDIPASLSEFFPADCFGGRGRDERGAEIEIRYGGKSRRTDMRIKSSITISPRARFVSYFSSVGAKADDIIRIGKIDERTFELTHQSR